MLSPRILAAGFLVLMTGCQAQESEPAAAKRGPQAVAPKPVVDTSRVAIFSYDKKRDQRIFQVYDEKLGEYIPRVFKLASLSPADLAQVETLLKACIDEYNQPHIVAFQKLQQAQPKEVFKADDFIINLPKYKRQLVAVTNAKGEKEVWVNCFCGDESINWHHEILVVKDGGNCYFNVKVSLTRQKWYDLMVNDWA